MVAVIQHCCIFICDSEHFPCARCSFENGLGKEHCCYWQPHRLTAFGSWREKLHTKRHCGPRKVPCLNPVRTHYWHSFSVICDQPLRHVSVTTSLVCIWTTCGEVNVCGAVIEKNIFDVSRIITRLWDALPYYSSEITFSKGQSPEKFQIQRQIRDRGRSVTGDNASLKLKSINLFLFYFIFGNCPF